MFITLLIPDSIQILKEPWYLRPEWWAAIATFVAVVVALFGERFWEWLRRPKLSVEFDKNSERCFRWAIAPEDYRQDQEDRLFRNVRIWYFRLKVMNTGLTNIIGLIAKVELYDPRENKLADRFEPTNLNWILGVGMIDLAPKEEDYLNFVSQAIEPKDIKYKFRIEVASRSPRGIAWDRYLQPWKLKIIFYATNLSKPVKKYFEFIPNDSEDEPGELKETTVWD